MKILKGILFLMLCSISILGLAQTAEKKEKPAVQVEGEEKKVFADNKTVDSLIRKSLTITKNSRTENDAYMKLVELGDLAVPALLRELVNIKLEPSHYKTKEPAHFQKEYDTMKRLLRILSEIGTEKTLPFIEKAIALNNANNWPSIRFTHYKEMIQIWNSPDRLEQLIAALEKPYLRKWAIYKLGVLGDKKAIEPLQKILDGSRPGSRESARDSIKHIESQGNVPLHYKYHRASQTFKIKTAKQIFQPGETIPLEYELIAGEYGSQALLRFKEAKGYLLPFGVAGPQGYSDWRGRYQLHVRMMKPYSLPVKKIELSKEVIEEKAIERFRFAAGEHIKGIIDLSKACKLLQPGEYRIHIGISNYVNSNMIKIQIQSTQPPRIIFDKLVHDLGEIQPGTRSTCDFKFTNTGTGFLKVHRTESGSGCTNFPPLTKKDYAPGESGAIKVKFVAPFELGTVTKHLYLESNDKENPKTTLTIKAKIVQKVNYQPNELQLSLKEKNGGCPAIILTSSDNQTFEIRDFKSKLDCITAEYDASMTATKFIFQPKVDIKKLRKCLNGKIEIRINHPQCEMVVIPFKTPPEFRSIPRLIPVPKAEPQKPHKRKIRILSNYAEDFEVESTASEKGFIKVLSQEKIDKGFKFELQIIPPARKNRQGFFTDEFLVNIKGGEQVEIMCLGIYAKSLKSEVVSDQSKDKILQNQKPAVEVEGKNGKAIALVLGNEIFSRDIEPIAEMIEKNKNQMTDEQFDQWLKQYRESELRRLIFGPLLKKYADEQKVDVTDAEISEFSEGRERVLARQTAEWQQARDDMAKELEVPDISDVRRKKIESRIERFDKALDRRKTRRSNKKHEGPAKAFVGAWKVNKSLFKRYGGRVIFQQGGPEPLDAYREFLKQQENAGRFEIKDKQTADLFWNYFTNDDMHTFFSDANKAAKSIEEPWWLMDTPEDSQKPAVQLESIKSERLYQKQDSIRYALEFIGTPEELIDTTLVGKRGQLASPQQLNFANKLFSVRKSKDVDMFISLLSDGTKKHLNDGNNRRMLHQHIKEISAGTFLSGEEDFNFFATFRDFTDKDRDRLKKHVSFAEPPTHAIVYWHFSKNMLLGSTLYLIEDKGSYKLVTDTLLSDPIVPVKKKQPTGPKEYGIVSFKQNDNAYTQRNIWKYEWDIELSAEVSENNTFQILKTTKVISGQADLHPEIAVQKIIDESVIEKYKYKGLQLRFRVGDNQPNDSYKYGQHLSAWSYGYSIASFGMSASMFLPGKEITNVKPNRQGHFVGSDLELLSFETSEGDIKYEHKVILRKDDSPEAKSAALLRLEQMTQRRISNKKLYYLKKMMTAYANDHNSTYPDRLEQIKSYDTDEWLDWLLKNIEYFGKGKTLAETPDTVLAYDKTLLGKTGSTNVLFDDGPVQYCNPDWLKKLGITGAKKPGVEVEGGTIREEEMKQRNYQYLLFLPEGYGERQEKWPLILFLHGSGERGDDLEAVKKHGPAKIVETDKKFAFVVVSPQCPRGEEWSNDKLITLLDEIAAQYNVDNKRIYLTGLSMGGKGTWDLACAFADRFAAIAPICGWGDPEKACNIKDVPIWAFHGAKDKAVPISRDQEMVDAVKASGGNVKFTIYPDTGHDSWTVTYENNELYDWFLKHRQK